MADIGKKIKEIEVQPFVEPDPTYVPDEPPARERTPKPVKEPAESCSLVRS